MSLTERVRDILSTLFIRLENCREEKLNGNEAILILWWNFEGDLKSKIKGGTLNLRQFNLTHLRTMNQYSNLL